MKTTSDCRAHNASATAIPFTTTEEAWFWFMQAQTARAEGAKISAGIGHKPRPCEPVDILTVLDRLYRGRRLVMDHLRVLHHYGLRLTAPDPRRPREARAHKLWSEALEHLGSSLIHKGIVARGSWVEDCHV